MPTQEKVRTYEQKVTEFNDLYAPFTFIDCEGSQDGQRCELCGSHAPGHFYLYEDKNGNLRHVGGDCNQRLITTWRGRCEGCHTNQTVTKIEIRLPNGKIVTEPLCKECRFQWLKRPHREGENRLYNMLMEKHQRRTK